MVTLTDRNELFCLFIKYQRFQRAANLAYFRVLIHITNPKDILIYGVISFATSCYGLFDE